MGSSEFTYVDSLFFRYPIKCPLLVDIIKERDHKMGDAANNIYLIVV